MSHAPVKFQARKTVDQVEVTLGALGVGGIDHQFFAVE